jgi:hypothetical protein
MTITLKTYTVATKYGNEILTADQMETAGVELDANDWVDLDNGKTVTTSTFLGDTEIIKN